MPRVRLLGEIFEWEEMNFFRRNQLWKLAKFYINSSPAHHTYPTVKIDINNIKGKTLLIQIWIILKWISLGNKSTVVDVD
jgi:hypothetical protein